jgi:hypothetical protein
MQAKDKPEFVAPLSVTFPMDGEDVTISAANVGQLGRMLEALSPMLGDLMALGTDTLERLVSPAGPTHGDVLELLELLSERREVPVQLVTIATGWPVLKVEALLPDRFAYLFAVALQVNADFFGRALPVLQAAGQKLSAMRPAPSSSTSGPASSAS